MKKEIIGRSQEVATLQQLLDTNKSEFLAVYGRRRVGKTFLIREYYREHTIFHCSGINVSAMDDQLDIFYEALLRAGLPATSAPTSWIEAFRSLKVLIDLDRSKKKKVIFLDEISWMDTPRSKFIPALSHFWNTYCEDRSDIILVVCGSVSTWIMDNILNDRGELHNRSTRRIRLKPFSLYESRAYLAHRKVKLAQKDLTTLYMLIGGIPYYLNAVQPGRSIPQIMDDLFFGSSADLRNEYENLYPALFRNADNHIEVIEALSRKNMGLTRKEIIKNTTMRSGGTFSKVLVELESCGFLQKIHPADKKKEDALYRLMDEYSIFYHKFIKPAKVRSGVSLGNSQAFTIWSGFAFENLCIRHSTHIAHALQIAGTDYRIYSYKDKADQTGSGAQIDLAIDRVDAVNIIEAKYYNDVYALTATEAKKIRQRVLSYINKTKTKKSVFKTLITPYGATRNEHYLSEITNDIVVDDLFVDVPL